MEEIFGKRYKPNPHSFSLTVRFFRQYGEAGTLPGLRAPGLAKRRRFG